MPFVSQAQRRWMFANDPKMARRWARHTPDMKKLPDRKIEGPEGDDPDYDADLDAATTPFKGSNPFEPRATSKAATDTRGVGSLAVTNAKKPGLDAPRSADAQRRRSNADVAAAAATDKPKYRGTFVGQQADAGRQAAWKNVSWQKPGGERGYGRVQGMQPNKPWVWDGSDWVKPGAFDAKFPRKREGVSPTWAGLLEAVLAEAGPNAHLSKLGVDTSSVTDGPSLARAAQAFVSAVSFGAKALGHLARSVVGEEASGPVVRACDALVEAAAGVRKAAAAGPSGPGPHPPGGRMARGAGGEEWFEPDGAPSDYRSGD